MKLDADPHDNGARFVKKIRLRQAQIGALMMRAGGLLLKSSLFAIWLGLCALRIWVGTQARPEPGAVPFRPVPGTVRDTPGPRLQFHHAARFVGGTPTRWDSESQVLPRVVLHLDHSVISTSAHIERGPIPIVARLGQRGPGRQLEAERP